MRHHARPHIKMVLTREVVSVMIQVSGGCIFGASSVFSWVTLGLPADMSQSLAPPTCLHWRSCGSRLVRHNVCSRRDLWRNANGNGLMSAHALESPSRSWNGPAPKPWQAGWKVHWTHTWVCGKPRDDLLQPTTEENCLLQT